MTLPCVFLMGPTASGKTHLAMQLIEALPLEIISVDSAMIYRGMDIGTAKPSHAELTKAPHQLIDIRDPAEHYSAGQFVNDVKKLMDEMHQRGKIPLLVGGTMLYFNALCRGIAELPERDAAVRAQIEQAAALQGWPALHQQLKEIDPLAAAKIKPNDRQRIERALEVYYLTQQPISILQQQNQQASLDILPIAIAPLDRKLLHERIFKRCVQMLKDGLVDEVKALKARGDLSLVHASMRAVGYRQVWEFLDQPSSEAELLERMVVATRQYAKRQLTWLRSFPEVMFFDSESPDLYSHVKICIENFLKGYHGKT